MWANDTCNYRTNSQTEILIDWLTNHSLQLVNIPGVTTFAAHSGRGLPLVIDLTFANGQVAQYLMLYNWTVRQDLSYESDHHAIQWTLFYNAQSINNLIGQCYNTKDTDIKEWTKTLEANLNLHYAPLHLLLDKNKTLSTKELDEAASALTRVISLTNKQAAKIRRPSAAAKPWWNSELSQIAGKI